MKPLGLAQTLAAGYKWLRNLAVLEILSLLCRTDMTRLSNNIALYDYLLHLAEVLRGKGAERLADDLQFAARQSTGLSTEFLGESLIALRKVEKFGGDMLKGDDRSELASVIKQVEFVLKR